MSLSTIQRRDFLTCAGATALLTLRPDHAFARMFEARAGSTKTGYVYDERLLDHQHYTERSERLVAINQRMKQVGLDKEFLLIAPSGDPVTAIRLVHTDAHIERINAISTTGTVAQLAVAGVLRAVDAVCGGDLRNAFCGIRPPGHHAHNSGDEEGFCFYGNVAIAAKYAQATYPTLVKRVLIIDWDFHHGNGTQDVFYGDPTVLFFSTHNWHAYPMTGNPALKGEGDGLGFNINVHMEPGSGDDDFVSAWEQQLLPAADSFKPDLVLISAGFDSKRNDLLGSFNLTECGFARLTRMAMDIADAHCSGRLVSVLEGGYADADTGSTFNGLARCVSAHVETLIRGTTTSACTLSARPSHAPARGYDHYLTNGKLYIRTPPGETVTVSILTTDGRLVLRTSIDSRQGDFCIGKLPLTGCFVGRLDRAGHKPEHFQFDLYRR